MFHILASFNQSVLKDILYHICEIMSHKIVVYVSVSQQSAHSPTQILDFPDANLYYDIVLVLEIERDT